MTPDHNGTNALSARTAIRAALGDSDYWVRHEAELAMKTLQAVRQSDDTPKSVERGGAATRSQPVCSGENRGSPAAASGR